VTSASLVLASARSSLRAPVVRFGHIAGSDRAAQKGVEHKPCANAEVKLLLIEPRGVVNTGEGATGERTVQNDQWI